MICAIAACSHTPVANPDPNHTHPNEEYIYFSKTDAPHFTLLDPGEKPYRIFTQIKVSGEVRTAIFDWPFPQR